MYYADIFKGEERILRLSSWSREELEAKAVAAFRALLPPGVSKFTRRNRGGNEEILVKDLRLVLYR